MVIYGAHVQKMIWDTASKPITSGLENEQSRVSDQIPLVNFLSPFVRWTAHKASYIMLWVMCPYENRLISTQLTSNLG